MFPLLDDGAVIKSFRIQADVRIGGGTSSPADGFSFNLARPGDPVLDDGDGYASSPTGETNLPEEGTTTGLAIGFDEWFSGGEDVIGLSVRIDDQLIDQFGFPEFHGDFDDTASLQTGPANTDPSGLGWAPFSIDLDSDKNLLVTYKGVTAFDGVVNFDPGPLQPVIAGSTRSDANSAHHIDNISISTDVQQIPGLVAHYPFDETSGVFTLLDISGNGHHATTSGVDTGVAGFDGNAVRFDQVDDSVLIPSIPDAIGDMTPDTEMTVSLWVKEENFFADNEQRSLFTVRNGTGNEIQFLWDRTPAGAGPDNDGFKVVQFETIGGAFAGTFVTGGRVEGSGTPLGFGDGEWHHVVFERRGTMTHIYVDGKPKAWGPTVVGPQLAGGEAAIGNSIQTLVQAMNGSIDDVQIYDYGIGEDAVEWLFQNPGEPFDINDCNGDGVVDIQDVNCACEAGDTDLADAIIIAIGSIVGDADGNGTVDFPDFVRLSNNFQEPGQYTDGDFNWDGTVTFLDFVLLSNNFGSSGGGSGTFDSPEPTSLGLLGLGGLLLGRALRGSRNGAKAQRK